jgi:CheY-specific phosphatase CheX
MDTSLIAAFSKASLQIMSEIGLPGAVISQRTDLPRESEMLCSIGITGQLHGCFILRFAKSSVRTFVTAFASSMGMEDEDPSDPTFARAAIAEFSNQLCGRCVMMLAEIGTDCLITPPTVISGTGVGTSIPALNDTIEFGIEDEFGLIGFFIGLKN